MVRYDDDRLKFLLNAVPGFWQQDEESNNHKALNLIANTFNDANGAISEINRLWHIDTSYGQGLDGIGKDVGLSRKGMSDDQYRRLLKVKRYLDMSDGTIPNLQIIFDAFLGEHYLYLEEGHTAISEPAAVVLNISKNSTQIPYEVAHLAKSGGVRIYYSTTWDKLTVVVYAVEYEHKVYYPITNVECTGTQYGQGDHLTLVLTPKEYEHKVFLPITNVEKTSASTGFGEVTEIEVTDKSMMYIVNETIVGGSYCGGLQQGFFHKKEHDGSTVFFLTPSQPSVFKGGYKKHGD